MSLTLDPTTGVDVATDAVARAVKAGAEEAKASHVYSEKFEVNFDTNDVTLVRTTVTDAVSVTVFDGKRKGTADITGRSHDLVEGAVDQAVAAARAGHPDDANVLPSEPVIPVTAPDDGPTEADREAMVDVVLAHIARLKSEYPQLRTDSSVYTYVNTWSTYADSNDRIQHARQGRYYTSVMFTGRDEKQAASTSFNYTSIYGRDPFASITDLGAVQQLITDTLASFDARAIPATFTGDVIFTPASLGILLGTVLQGLGGMALQRKVTPFADKMGEQIAVPGLSVLHRPQEVAGAAPFDGDGFANRDLDIIKDGRLESFLIGWFHSLKLGMPMTSAMTDLVVPGGDVALDDIIADTKEGIVLGRFSGGMPNANLDFSGVAKNSFYVKDGKIQHPLSETMIAGNFIAALKAIKAISREQVDNGLHRFPWLSVGGVTVSTK